MGSTKSAKRELRSISGEPILRSFMELQRNNFKKAMKVFSSCPQDAFYYANNEALINYNMGKKNTAVHMLHKIISSATPEMLYNLAIMNLFTGNFQNAYNILFNLIPYFKHNPRLWFRLAECKLEELKEQKVDDFDLISRKQDIVWGYVGEGLHRKLVLRGCTNEIKGKDDLIFARRCLLNALCLIKIGDEIVFYPSNYPTENELKRFKIAVYLSLSYVNLSLCDYLMAHNYASEALNLSPTGYQKVLAHLYAGEALILLDKIREAIRHFSPDVISEDSAKPKSESSGSGGGGGSGNGSAATGAVNVTSERQVANTVDWYPHTAKVVLCYNLSVAYTLRGEYNKASETLRSIGPNLSGPNEAMLPIQVIILAIYIQLAQGYVDLAKSIIKQHLPQYRR